MANLKCRKATRRVSLRKKNRTTRLPYSIQKELEAGQGATEGYHQAAPGMTLDVLCQSCILPMKNHYSSGPRAEVTACHPTDIYSSTAGIDSDESTSPSPQQHQISRKDRRKKRRVQQRQQKHEHQLMRKEQRMGRAAEAFLSVREGPLSNKRSRRLMNSQVPEQRMKVAFSTDESEDLNSLASDPEDLGCPADGGSIGAAAAALKKQQQEQSTDTLSEGPRLLERRLYKHKAATKNTEEALSRRAQKLRQESNELGFEFELRSVLDGIAV
ncbi:hypothetical protein Emag_000022 [Eimeria magna]